MRKHRNRHIEFWLEKAARAVVTAQQTKGVEATAERIEASISEADYATTVRVLHILARELGGAVPRDLTALDAQLRSMAGLSVQPDGRAAEPSGVDQADVEQPTGASDAGADAAPRVDRRNLPKGPGGLRSSMIPKRR